MRIVKRSLNAAVLLVAASVATAFAGCGGEDDAEAPPTTSRSTQSSTTSIAQAEPLDDAEAARATEGGLPAAIAGCLSDYDFTGVKTLRLDGQMTSLVTGRSPEGANVDIIPVDTRSAAAALSRKNPLDRPVAFVSQDRLSAVFFSERPAKALTDSISACTDREQLLGPPVSADALVTCLQARGFTGFEQVDTDSAGTGIRAFLPGGKEEIALFDFDDRADAEAALEGLDQEYEGDLPATLIPGGRFILSGEGVNQAIRGGDVRECLDG